MEGFTIDGGEGDMLHLHRGCLPLRLRNESSSAVAPGTLGMVPSALAIAVIRDEVVLLLSSLILIVVSTLRRPSCHELVLRKALFDVSHDLYLLVLVAKSGCRRVLLEP
jgi:hypothetical protein